MKDFNGLEVRINCRVTLWEGYNGCVVIDFDNREAVDGYSENEWTDNKVGVMILADSGQLFYYDEPDEHFEIVTPAA